MLMLERPAYYILCPTCHSRGLRVGILPLALHLSFPTFLSPKLSPLVFGHVGTRKHWASQEDLVGPGRRRSSIHSCPTLDQFGVQVWSFPPLSFPTMKEGSAPCRRLWVSGIEALC